MKKTLILSENKELKKELTTFLLEIAGKDKINYTTVSNRPNTISELSQNEFHGLIIDCPTSANDLQLILKYISTNDYYFCHIFFLSSDFTVFQEILKHLNFPNINLISLPVNTKELAQHIITSLYPPDTSKIDKSVKINLEFLKVFIDGTKKVFTDFCNLEKVVHQKPYLKNQKNSIEFAIIGQILLKSQTFEGAFLIGFTKEIYLNLINKVLMLNTSEITDDILDFSAELVNMVYGQAKLVLNDSGHNFLKVIPTFEENYKYSPSKGHIVVVPIETEIGNIYIEVTVLKIEGMEF